MKNLSIKKKLIWITAAASTIVFIITAVVFSLYDQYSFRQQALHELVIQGQVVGANTGAAMSFGYDADAVEALSALKADPQIETASLYDHKGKLFASYIKSTGRFQPPMHLSDLLNRDRSTFLEAVTPIMWKGEPMGSLVIMANQDRLAERQQSYFMIVSLLTIAGIALVIGIATRLQQLISKPILSLVETMAVVSENKDYSIRVPQTSNDEIGQLVNGFNGMLGEIEIRNNDLEERVALRTADLSSEILERKKAEEAAHSLAEEAQAANKAKSQFLANMSHEIRTPMNGVIGMVDLMQLTELDEDQREYAKIIETSALGLLDVINDILDFSKAEAGMLILQPEEFSLPLLIEEVGEILATQADAKGLELVCHTDPRIPVQMSGDRGRLRQVLFNLVGNAIKFTKTGEVVLEARLLGRHDSNICLSISVRDTGVGISPEQHSAIFESFTQADGSNTRQHGGTGLGLTISRQIIELMGGVLAVESEPGHGSTFTCTISLPEAAENPVRMSDLKGLRVLGVDDNETNRKVLSELLASWDCEADVVIGGREAMVCLATPGAEYDLILMDMQMPFMDGIETTRRIREDLQIDMPVVLLTSVGTFLTPESIKAHGFNRVLSKPIRGSRLFTTLLNVMNTDLVKRAA
jgi:signal transduction histidine kinase/ActR/RegA family two-component response regulator